MALTVAEHAADTDETEDSSLNPRPVLSGAWLLDKDSSDDLAAKMNEGRKILWALRSLLLSRIRDTLALVRDAGILRLRYEDRMLLIIADDRPRQQSFMGHRGVTEYAKENSISIIVNTQGLSKE